MFVATYARRTALVLVLIGTAISTGTSRLQFRSVNADSYGGIIDNVNLTGTGFVKGSALPFKVTAALADTDGVLSKNTNVA